MKKIILLSIAVILLLGAAAGAYWWSTRPQVITFSDDATLTLLGVDFGKRHTQPGSKTAKTTATAGRQTGGRGSFTTATDTLVVWVKAKYDPQQYHYFQYYLYDKAGTACAQSYGQNYSGARQGNEVFAIQLEAFPRRESKMYLRVQEQGNGSQELSEQKLVIHNPVHGKTYSKWTPDPLPSTKEDDDMSVTLTKLVAGADMPYSRIQDETDNAANKGVQAVFHVERGGKPVSNWQPVSVETSDATGNRVNGGVSQNNWQGNEDTVTYQYGLWPDEPAWKLKIEFSQQSDFTSNELWAVTNIPIQPGRQQDFYNYNGRRAGTNAAFAEADVDGYHVKVFPVKQFTDVPPNSQPQGGLTLQITPSLKSGMQMTFVKLTDDQGGEIGNWNSGTMGNGTSTTYNYGLRDITGATNVNFTLALHKSHFFEFTAKPEKAQP